MGYILCPTHPVEWIVGVVGTVLLLFPHVIYDTIGIDVNPYIVDFAAIGLFVLVLLSQKVRLTRNPNLALPLHERMKLKESAK